MMTFLRFEFLGQYKTLSSLKVTWNPSSTSPKIEIRFLFIPGTNRTSFNFSVTPIFSCIEQVPIPLTGCVELSPMVTPSEM